jgi:hypothetical protein
MAEYGDSLIVQKLFSGVNGAEYPAQLAAYWQALAVFGRLWQALAVTIHQLAAHWRLASGLLAALAVTSISYCSAFGANYKLRFFIPLLVQRMASPSAVDRV